VRERRIGLSLTADSGSVCLKDFQVGKALADKKTTDLEEIGG
jgi:hypothetical protein